MLVAVLALLTAGHRASGGIYYRTDAVHYSVPAGELVDVHIYLDFTGADATSLVAENGLYGAGVTCTVTQSTPFDSPAVIVAGSDMVANAAVFDDSLGAVKDFDQYFASLLETVDPYMNDGDKGAVGNLVGVVRRIDLGHFRYSTGAFPGETTTIWVGDYDPTTDDTVTWESFQVLDGFIQPTIITITTTGDYCPSDFNLDGFVDTDDFTDWVNAFVLGDDSADFDKSGFVDTDDFTAFVLQFETGC